MNELFPKLADTWIETYKICIDRGYIDINGKREPLIVGHEMKTQVNKCVEDLKNPRYIYDTKESARRMKFKETCCFQGKKPFFMKPLRLMLHQKAFWEVVYSFKMADTGLRRYTEVLEVVSRKNGKSTDLASDGAYDLFLGDGGEDIVCASNDDKQASLIWREIAGMRGRLDPKKELTRDNLIEIRNDNLNITIFKMSEKTQNKDGRNIDKTYYDEMHDSKTDEIFMACWESMSIKDEPLLITCTTEGFLNDMLLDKKMRYARGVLNDEIEDEHFLPWLFTQDSESEIFQDKWSWCKSNPSLIYGVKKWDFIEKNMIKAKHSKSSRVHMLCKDFNIKQNTAEAWLFESDYNYAQEVTNLEDFRGYPCFAGVDLSQTTDLSCVVLLFMKPHDDRKYIFTKYFIPETKLDKDKDAGAKYEDWAEKGFVRVHEGNTIKLDQVAKWFEELGRKYDIKPYKVGYDLKFATDFLNTMKMLGYTYGNRPQDTCQMIQQSKYVMSTPMKYVEADLHSQLIHGLNEMDKWCLSNVALEMDSREMIMAGKMKPEKRIDGAVALIICYAIFSRYMSDYIQAINGGGY